MYKSNKLSQFVFYSQQLFKAKHLSTMFVLYNNFTHGYDYDF